MKVCNKCNLKKTSSEFYKNKSSKDGLTPSCKECIKERSRLWRKNNPKPPKPRKDVQTGFRLLPEGMRKCSACKKVKEKTLFYADSSRASGVSSKCKECANEYHKKRREERGLEALEVRRSWTNKNREKIREQQRVYAENNRDKRKLNEARRRARKSSLPDALTIDETLNLLREFNHRCAICLGEYEHLDHFIPISSGYGGTVIENIVPMCSRCNISKGSKNPFLWAKTLSKNNRERFDSLVKYLVDINGIAAVEDYEAHVTNCFK